MLHLRPDKRRSRRRGDRTRLFRHPRVHDIDALFPCEEHFLTTHVVHNDTTVAAKNHCVAPVTDFAEIIQWLGHGSHLIRRVVGISTLRHSIDLFLSSVGDLISSSSMVHLSTAGALRIFQRNIFGEVQWCHTFSSSRIHDSRDADPTFRVINVVDVRAVVGNPRNSSYWPHR